MNALELALQGAVTMRDRAPILKPDTIGHGMARALVAWAEAHDVQHRAVADLRAALARGGDVLAETDAFWFELPESTEVRPARG